jgi:hypothetical protein
VIERPYVEATAPPPNQRPGADAGWRFLFAIDHSCPRAAQAER